MNQEEFFKKITSHAKEYGFVFPSSDIYDGLSAVYDYGQNGVELKNNIRQYWWKAMVQMHENIVGVDAAIFMHPTVWHLLLKKSAVLFGVFFAQVIDSNEHAIGGLRWRGIPKKTGYAFVIGEPYYSLLKLNAYRGEKIGENQMYFTAKCRPRIPSKYISRRKLFWPAKTVSHEMNTVARDIPIT